MILATSLNTQSSGQRTRVFLLPLGDAGGEAALPPTELDRADAEPLAPNLRSAFLARRRLLRRAVGLRLGIAPGDVLIARDANGAPRVTSAREPIFVSLAARGELVAIGVSDRPVGVDVEVLQLNPPEPAWNILHPREREWLSSRSVPTQRESFLALWCVKEAYLKAIGLGLRREPAKIAVSLADGSSVSIEDTGQRARLDEAFVTRAEAHGTSASLACVVLAR